MTEMTSNQPYLLRAFFDWIVDNELTPYIVVDANNALVDVPTEFVKDGQIVLNVSPSACVNFYLDKDGLSFQARFGGQPRLISMPCQAVLAIYARENGAGTVFAMEPEEQANSSDSQAAEHDDPIGASSPTKPSGKPNLKVVK